MFRGVAIAPPGTNAIPGVGGRMTGGAFGVIAAESGRGTRCEEAGAAAASFGADGARGGTGGAARSPRGVGGPTGGSALGSGIGPTLVGSPTAAGPTPE